MVIHIEGGLISGITSSCEIQAINADYDVDGNINAKITPYGAVASIEFYTADCSPDEIAEWVALANQ